MAQKSTTYHKGSNGKSYTTTTTRYDGGGSKSVTREGGGLFSSGRLVNVTRTK